MGLNSKLKLIVAVTLLIIPAFSSGHIAHAEEKSLDSSTSTPVSVLQVTPIMNELAVKPGDVIKRQISAKNLARIPIPMKAYTRAFVATNEFGDSDYPDDTATGSVQSWFKIDEPDFILQPDSPKNINVTITVPQNARPGGQYATLFVESLLPKEVLTETSLYLSSRIGALFFFVVAGDLVEKGQISEFKTDNFWKTGPVEFNVAFKNEGNVDLKPQSTLTITDWRGNKVYETTDQGKRTLPEKTRRWKLEWETKWLLGRYTARLSTKNLLDSKVQVSEVQFYSVPVFQITIGLVSVLFIYFVLIRGRGRLKKAFKVLAGKEVSEVIPEPPLAPVVKQINLVKKEKFKILKRAIVAIPTPAPEIKREEKKIKGFNEEIELEPEITTESKMLKNLSKLFPRSKTEDDDSNSNSDSWHSKITDKEKKNEN